MNRQHSLSYVQTGQVKERILIHKKLCQNDCGKLKKKKKIIYSVPLRHGTAHTGKKKKPTGLY